MDKFTFYDIPVFNHFMNPIEVMEIRVLNAFGNFAGQRIHRRTLSGYFDNHADFCKALKPIVDGTGKVYQKWE